MTQEKAKNDAKKNRNWVFYLIAFILFALALPISTIIQNGSEWSIQLFNFAVYFNVPTFLMNVSFYAPYLGIFLVFSGISVMLTPAFKKASGLIKWLLGGIQLTLTTLGSYMVYASFAMMFTALPFEFQVGKVAYFILDLFLLLSAVALTHFSSKLERWKKTFLSLPSLLFSFIAANTVWNSFGNQFTNLAIGSVFYLIALTLIYTHIAMNRAGSWVKYIPSVISSFFVGWMWFDIFRAILTDQNFITFNWYDMYGVMSLLLIPLILLIAVQNFVNNENSNELEEKTKNSSSSKLSTKNQLGYEDEVEPEILTDENDDDDELEAYS